jgi:hypothetical protein
MDRAPAGPGSPPLPGPAPLVSPMSYPIGTVRPAVALPPAVLAVMAIASRLRSLIASARGMDTAPEDKVAVMSMRAAANELGYLVGAEGGLAVGLVGFKGLGIALEAMFLVPAVSCAPRLLSIIVRAAPQAAG